MINKFERYHLKFSEGKIVLPKWCKRIKIDIGLSSHAPQTKIWLENQSDLIVFGFEPVKDNFDKIIKGTGKMPKKYINSNVPFHVLDPRLIGKRAFIFPFALGNVSGTQKKKIYVTSEDKGCSSLYKPKWPKIIQTQTTNVISLDYFTSLLPFDKNINFIEHIKSDCQGADLDILLAGKKTLMKTAVYTIECENNQYYKTNNSLKTVKQYFKKRKFLKYNFVNKLINFSHLKKFDVEDPTFYNPKYLKFFKKEDFFIYQKG
jgi:hypothetical protein